MSLYADYLKEREGLETIESAAGDGFLTYTVTEEYLYIVDIYTKPEARRTGAATKLEAMAAAVARSCGLSHLMGSVALNVEGVAVSLKMMINRGYTFQSFNAEKQIMYFLKGI